ncbi:MAG: electron transfer flavoprotein subunit beta/FixA family protein [Erysipelotrichaceae bacterium]|nr:electron transfer flavoprotein subunit beta/FixA family protein [Erysipelotrichaceae bacterium]
MNIVVCVKQVPDTTEIKIDPVTNTLIRKGVPSILNPFDRYALELALKIKDQNPETKISLVSMGPPQAEAVLREGISLGADKAYLVTDRAFGGADTLATSYTLCLAIDVVEGKEDKADLILCGKQAIDGDTAQVGPEIAEQRDLPQISCVLKCELRDGKLVAKKETDDGFAVIETQLPCLITATKNDEETRLPKVKDKIRSLKTEIVHITAADVAADPNRLGLKGSPTKVAKSYARPVVKKETEKLDARAEGTIGILAGKIKEAL